MVNPLNEAEEILAKATTRTSGEVQAQIDELRRDKDALLVRESSARIKSWGGIQLVLGCLLCSVCDCDLAAACRQTCKNSEEWRYQSRRELYRGTQPILRYIRSGLEEHLLRSMIQGAKCDITMLCSPHLGESSNGGGCPCCCQASVAAAG